MSYIDPIDCESDPCLLAWLIRDNRNLLPAVYLGQCSNGTVFEELDPNGYNDCPTLIATETTPVSANQSILKITFNYTVHRIF